MGEENEAKVMKLAKRDVKALQNDLQDIWSPRIDKQRQISTFSLKDKQIRIGL
jgi:hypothetical protein